MVDVQADKRRLFGEYNPNCKHASSPYHTPEAGPCLDCNAPKTTPDPAKSFAPQPTVMQAICGHCEHNNLWGTIELCKFHAGAPQLLAALQAIAGMSVDTETDYRQLSALCVAIAQQAIEAASA